MNIIIYGGNGFVGSRVARALQKADAIVSCVSRSGRMPEQLVGDYWAQQVQWLPGDAGDPDLDLLAQQDVLISTVGAPPVPTITDKAYQRSLYTNGVVNERLIDCGLKAGIKRVILQSANIPGVLQGEWFAYAKGKRLAMEAAKKFADASDAHSAVVVQPGGIFGKRHTQSGREIHLDWILGPMARVLPSQFISVDRVAQCLADAALGLRATEAGYITIPHSEI